MIWVKKNIFSFPFFSKFWASWITFFFSFLFSLQRCLSSSSFRPLFVVVVFFIQKNKNSLPSLYTFHSIERRKRRLYYFFIAISFIKNVFFSLVFVVVRLALKRFLFVSLCVYRERKSFSILKNWSRYRIEWWIFFCLQRNFLKKIDPFDSIYLYEFWLFDFSETPGWW